MKYWAERTITYISSSYFYIRSKGLSSKFSPESDNLKFIDPKVTNKVY